MLRDKLVFATIAVSVLFACDYTHAYKFGDFTKSIISKVKNSKTVSSDTKNLKNSTEKGISSVTSKVYSDLKGAGSAAGKNISNQYNQNIKNLTNAVSGEEQSDIQSINSAYTEVIIAQKMYEAKKHINASPTEIYNAAVDYDNKAKIYEEKATQAAQTAQDMLTKLAQDYQNAVAISEYFKSHKNDATNLRIAADKILQESQTSAAALPVSVQ